MPKPRSGFPPCLQSKPTAAPASGIVKATNELEIKLAKQRKKKTGRRLLTAVGEFGDATSHFDY
ncbi:MAG TPA: hypothetical protein VND90_04730 [Terracidiphilus sp.]|nr:hypothetical protein [Terracidiphilus sp.]